MNEKCVMIIDADLPLGEIANTAAVLGITLGGKLPGYVGENVADGSGNSHIGIIKIPVPDPQSEPRNDRQAASQAL